MISAERRAKTRTIIKKRLRQIKRIQTAPMPSDFKQHRLAKRTAFGCRRANCQMCRESDKNHEKKRRAEYS